MMVSLMKNLKSTLLPLSLLIASLFFGVSCERKTPVEEAGENIGDAVEETGDAIKDATN